MYKLPADTQVLGTVSIDRFCGVDFTNTPSRCALKRSPDAVNMTRVTPGKVGKRTGWEVLQKLPDAINGRHLLAAPDGETEFIHAGAKIYKYDPDVNSLLLVYSGANDQRSSAVTLSGYLWLFDGKKLLRLNKSSVVTAESVAKIPKIITGRAPNGGGVSLEPINLLTPKRCEGFYSTESSTAYQLTATGIDGVQRVERLSAAGEYVEVAAASYTANLETGTITFLAAPGVSPSEGKDDILVWYSKTVTGYAERVNKCTAATLFGVNGAQDRLFASGNPDLAGRDWFSELRDGSYWGDVWYGALGDEQSAILNYSIIDNRLAAFKQRGENNVNVYLRAGSMLEVTEQINGVDVTYYDPAFEVTGTYQSEEIAARDSFQMFDNEPTYLTKRGVHALTLISLTSERNSELRSYYLNGDGYRGLLTESGLEEACSAVWNGFYVLCVNSRCYLLDSLQPIIPEGSENSDSGKQFEGFYWDNVPARVIWTKGQSLYFGTADGRICRFFEDHEDADCYYDAVERGAEGEPLYGDAVPVACKWSTAYLRGRLPMNKLTVLSAGFTMGAFAVTGAKLLIMKQGALCEVYSDAAAGRFFTYEPFDYGAFTYGGDTTDQTYNFKVRTVRNVDKTQLSVQNDNAEPFSLERLELEYRQSGKFRNKG